MNTREAVASKGTTAEGNVPLIRDGSPIWVFVSPDQNINEIESFLFKLANTLFEIVYIWFASGASTNVVEPGISTLLHIKVVEQSVELLGAVPPPDLTSNLYVNK